MSDWKLAHPSGGVSMGAVAFIERPDGSGFPLADCTDDEARMIAAAPELLAALRGLVETQAAYIEALPGERGLSVLDAARAAIAKAEGRS